MERTLKRPTDLLAPAVGAVYLVLWWIGEAGRLGNGVNGTLASLLPFVLFGLAIGVSQRWPAVALSLVGATLLLQVLVEGTRFTSTSWPAYLPLLYVVFNVSAYGRRALHWMALPVSAVFAFVVSMLLTLREFGGGGWPVLYLLVPTGRIPNDELDIVGMFAAVCVVAVGLAVGAWCAGLALRAARRAREVGRRALAIERDLAVAEAEVTALSERERLAQEVHDVMAHSLAVIAAQADGTRMLESDLPPRVRDALSTIADCARDGLTELRTLLDDVSDEPDAPRPGLADLDALLERVRGAGLTCELTALGEPRPLPPTRELSVYRIVQESLTNAVRHARVGGVATVTLDWRGPGLAVLVATPSTPSVRMPRPGRGIHGMHERARLAGGWLTAGPDEDGTFIVNAFIPVDEPATIEVPA